MQSRSRTCKILYVRMNKRLTVASVFIGILVTFSLAQEIPNEGVNITKFSKNFYSIPFIDLDSWKERQFVVDKEDGSYLGHPSSVLLEDGRTIIVTYPRGHGKGAIVMKTSEDGGLTWSERLPVPDNWSTSQEVPILYPVEDANGKKRIIMFSGKSSAARLAISEDQGKSWSDLKKIGDWSGIVVMSDLIPLKQKGHYMAMFHDDERFITDRDPDASYQNWKSKNLQRFTLYKTFSYDGGLSWTKPDTVFSSRVIHLCEPGIIRSPDSNQIAVLLRENSRRMNSHIIFSNDEGNTWTPPHPLPNSISGDRHQALYMPDGRLLISFRDRSAGYFKFNHLKRACKDCDEDMLYEQAGPISPTFGDWVAWVGTYEDLLEGREGQYRVRFKDNKKGSDCAYPAMELLPDGTVVAITYGHWIEGESPYILGFRFKIEELDQIVNSQ